MCPQLRLIHGAGLYIKIQQVYYYTGTQGVSSLAIDLRTYVHTYILYLRTYVLTYIHNHTYHNIDNRICICMCAQHINTSRCAESASTRSWTNSSGATVCACAAPCARAPLPEAQRGVHSSGEFSSRQPPWSTSLSLSLSLHMHLYIYIYIYCIYIYI